MRHSSGVHDLDWIVTDDGSRTLWDQKLQETYHSGCGAAAESLIVYLSNSGVLGRLQQGLATSVFEMGLGTCTTLLLTAAFAASRDTPLDYWAVDNRILPSEIIQHLDILSHLDRILQQNTHLLGTAGNVVRPDFEQMDSLLATLLAAWPSQKDLELLQQHDRKSAFPATMQSQVLTPSSFDIQLSQTIRLRLLVGDATQIGWSKLMGERETPFDSIFFDAFSPDSTPELWTELMLGNMYQLLQAGGTLTSYCVKSGIRRTLERVGFSVQRLPGPFAGKREVLLAVRAS
jgi:hypothetical protein